MALERPIQLPTGVEANYWRITQVSLRRDVEQAEICVAVFTNLAARRDGRHPHTVERYVIEGFTPAKLDGFGILRLAYGALKQHEDFAAAVDV